MKSKSKILKFVLFIAIDIVFLAICLWFIFRPDFSFIRQGFVAPQGIISRKEHQLFIYAVLIMLIAVLPVFFTLFYFAWKYRAGRNEEYSPDMQATFKSGLALWAIPAMIIITLSIINWKSTHDLDPYKPIASQVKPITIQVVALPWKWLFIYPDQNIATINYLEFPAGTPVNFQLTADAPMSSFWIPQLGGQMYAMAGMETHLHLQADHPGEYKGSAAEINGPGFAGMKFITKSTTDADFNSWVNSVKSSNNKLNLAIYEELSKQSENNPPAFYSAVDENLFDSIMMKFMAPSSTPEQEHHHQHEEMEMSGMK